jgi:hypothetical protein
MITKPAGVGNSIQTRSFCARQMPGDARDFETPDRVLSFSALN